MLRTLAQTVSRVRVPSYSARDALSNAAGGLLVVAWLRAQQSRHFAASEAATGAKTLPVRPANAVDSESDGVAAKGTQQQRQQQQQRRKAAQSDSGAPSPSKAEVNASRRASQERMLGRYSRAPDPPLLTSWLHWAETPEEVLLLIRKHIPIFSAIHVCAALNALAKHAGKCPAEELNSILADPRFDLVINRANEMMPTAQPRPLVTWLLACAKLQFNPTLADGKLWSDRITEAMLPQLSTFSGQQLSNTIYAHAFLGIRPAPDFLDRFIQVTLARMKSRDAAPQWISNTIWALASMDLHPGTVWLDTFQVMTSELLGAYAPQDLATTSYALAKFAYRPKPAWLLRLQEVALLKEDDFTEQALAIAAWSVLVLDTGKVCDSMLARAVDRLLEAATDISLNNRSWGILSQAFVAAQLEPDRFPTLNAVLAGVPGDMERRAHSAHLEMIRSAPARRMSKLQIDVAKALRAIGVECQEEFHCGASRLAVDIAVVLNGDRYAVEVDGPVHFFANHLTVRDGPTRFRDRLLRKAGWKVVAVPYYEWNAVPRSLRYAYLLRLLQDAGWGGGPAATGPAASELALGKAWAAEGARLAEQAEGLQGPGPPGMGMGIDAPRQASPQVGLRGLPADGREEFVPDVMSDGQTDARVALRRVRSADYLDTLGGRGGQQRAPGGAEGADGSGDAQPLHSGRAHGPRPGREGGRGERSQVHLNHQQAPEDGWGDGAGAGAAAAPLFAVPEGGGPPQLKLRTSARFRASQRLVVHDGGRVAGPPRESLPRMPHGGSAATRQRQERSEGSLGRSGRSLGRRVAERETTAADADGGEEVKAASSGG